MSLLKTAVDFYEEPQPNRMKVTSFIIKIIGVEVKQIMNRIFSSREGGSTFGKVLGRLWRLEGPIFRVHAGGLSPFAEWSTQTL